MNDLHDLAAAYVMDALDGAERAEYERHLESCEGCQADVARLAEPVVDMADALATPPSQEMRRAVLAEVAVTPQLGLPSYVVSLVPRLNRAVTYALGVAAVVLAVVAGVALFQLQDSRQIERIVTAADAETIVLTAEGFEARFTYSASEAQGVFVSDSLPDLATGQTYQLWLIDDDGAAPAGLFTPDRGLAVVLVPELRGGVTLGLTMEPEGGSPTPSGDILLEGALSS